MPKLLQDQANQPTAVNGVETVTHSISVVFPKFRGIITLIFRPTSSSFVKHACSIGLPTRRLRSSCVANINRKIFDRFFQLAKSKMHIPMQTGQKMSFDSIQLRARQSTRHDGPALVSR